MNALAKVRKTLAENELVVEGDSVLVALSGGPDSVALLHLLNKLRKAMRLTLCAVHVNHGIRPRASKKEERFCRSLCKRLGIELLVVSENIRALARDSRKGLEEAARDFRYASFEKLAADRKIGKIALGHHVDDRVETILFRIIRGTGRTGLRGIPIRRGRIVRPLYDFTKNELLDYLKKGKVAYCVDESNLTVDFSRNYIRNKLLPAIRRDLNPSVDGALLSLSETAADEESFLDSVVQRSMRKTVFRTPGGKIELDLHRFGSYDTWLRRRLLRCCLAELSDFGCAPDRIVVDRLDLFRQGDREAISLPGRVQAVLTADRLAIFRRINPSYSRDLIPGKSCRLTLPRLSFRCSIESRQNIQADKKKRSLLVALDYGKVSPPLLIRDIRPGDRFGPLGLKGTKKVGDYLTDRKVSRWYRDEIPVVCDKEGIIWLVGHEISDRVKTDQSTKEVLRIECTKRKKHRMQTI